MRNCKPFDFLKLIVYFALCCLFTGLGSDLSLARNKNFLEQQSDFNSLLSSLAESHGTVEAHKSKKRKAEGGCSSEGEEQAKKGDTALKYDEETALYRGDPGKKTFKFQRGRVIRNKDVSKYSAEDKAALFGIAIQADKSVEESHSSDDGDREVKVAKEAGKVAETEEERKVRKEKKREKKRLRKEKEEEE
jgi:hypothetical protein